MFEWIMAGAMVMLMSGIAEMEGQSGFIWGSLTLVTVIFSLFVIPAPFIRVVLGGFMGYLAMSAYKAINDRD